MSVHSGPKIPTNNLILSLDALNTKNYRSFSTNFIQNGNFLNGQGSPNESGSNPTNEIVLLPNPGDGNYVLRSYGNNTEYQLNLTTELVASTTYVMSGWYAKSSDYNGTDTMFHARAFSTSGNNNATGVDIGTTLYTTVVNGITWRYCYQTITTPSDYNNSFNWYLGYGTNNTTGYRYYTNLKVEKGTAPALIDSSGNNRHGSILNGGYYDNTNSTGILLDGDNDRIQTPSFTYTPYCVSVWLYNNNIIPGNDTAIGGPSTYQTLMSFGGSTPGVNLGGWTGSATNEAVHIWSNSGGNRLTYTNLAVAAGFHNFVFNWNGSNYDIWIDGVKQSVFAGGTGHAVLQTYTNSILYIGSDANTYEFNGRIFQYHMYEVALTDTQVVDLFYATRGRYSI